MDIGGTKMKAAQSCVDAVNNKIDTVTGQITKAQVGIKTAERWGSLYYPSQSSLLRVHIDEN